MDQNRKNEIAYRLLKAVLVHDLSLMSIGDFKRRAGKLAEETGISMEEVLVFGEAIVREIVAEQIQKGFARRSKVKVRS